MQMKLIFLTVTLLVAVTTADKCERTGDIKAKQAKLDKFVTYFNKPFNAGPQSDKHENSDVGYLDGFEIFSIFDEETQQEAVKVLEHLMNETTFDKMMTKAESMYNDVNEDMLHYCLSVAIVHHPDAQGLRLPRIHDVNPDKFLHKSVVEEMYQRQIQGEEKPLVRVTHDNHRNYVDPYRKLDYFLEDIGMNSHHYHWHVVRSALWKNAPGKYSKERTGELFYWMHRQMVARFDNELLSNSMPRVEPFQNWDEPIMVGYEPHLVLQQIGYNYMFRPEGMTLRDLNKMTKFEMRQWQARINYAIHKGHVLHENGTDVSLFTEHGIDTLANLMESNVNSMNRPYYGNLHSYAHVIASKIVDPNDKHNENSGVMYDVTTSARDPLFYMWHKFIDNIFTEYKDRLTPYSNYELNCPEVSVEDVHIHTHETHSEENEIHTFLNVSQWKLSKGFAFTQQSEPTLHVEHLNHEDFEYVIQLNNHGKAAKSVTVRIFLAPKYDEAHQPFDLNAQRSLMVELDKFVVPNVRPGVSTTRHESKDSNVAMPTEQIYGDVTRQDHEYDPCHCGWPEYMLLPKGNRKGMEFDLYVVVTDYEKDKVPSDPDCACKESMSYCGAIYDKYPDKRPMGYPFDRKITTSCWEEFHTPNMHRADVKIVFVDDDHKEHAGEQN